MASLPKNFSYSQFQFDFNSEYKSILQQFHSFPKGMLITNSGPVEIENLGGLVKIEQKESYPIDLSNIDTAIFYVNAPTSPVTLIL